MLVVKSESKRPLPRPKCRRENNIKMVLKEIKFVGIDSIHMAQDRGWWRGPVNNTLQLQVP
jgi:hypothetical protein